MKRFNEDFRYQAVSWGEPRRVIAKVEWHPGALLPEVGLMVTNLALKPDWMLPFFNQRGTAEQQIKKGKYASHWIWLSCRRSRDNQVLLQLHTQAYNLAKVLRCVKPPAAMGDCSLTGLQVKLIKIGARVVRHAQAITLKLAEVAVTGATMRAILAAMHRLPGLSTCV